MSIIRLRNSEDLDSPYCRTPSSVVPWTSSKTEERADHLEQPRQHADLDAKRLDEPDAVEDLVLVVAVRSDDDPLDAVLLDDWGRSRASPSDVGPRDASVAMQRDRRSTHSPRSNQRASPRPLGGDRIADHKATLRRGHAERESPRPARQISVSTKLVITSANT